MTADADSGNAPQTPSVALSECRGGTKRHQRQLHCSLRRFLKPLLQLTDTGYINNFPREDCRSENKMVGFIHAADDVRITSLPPLLVATSDQQPKEAFVN
jgi:hypothetical protein